MLFKTPPKVCSSCFQARGSGVQLDVLSLRDLNIAFLGHKMNYQATRSKRRDVRVDVQAINMLRHVFRSELLSISLNDFGLGSIPYVLDES